MTDLSSEAIANLIEIAGKATPGPWTLHEENTTGRPERLVTTATGHQVCRLRFREIDSHVNAAFIAAFNPSVVLQILTELQSLKAPPASTEISGMIDGLTHYAKGMEWGDFVDLMHKAASLLLRLSSENRALRERVAEQEAELAPPHISVHLALLGIQQGLGESHWTPQAIANAIQPIESHVRALSADRDRLQSELTEARKLLTRILPLAKNDAMMMDSLSRHQPVPGTETAEFGQKADDDMLAVNAAYALVGLEPPFAIGPPPNDR